MRAAVDHWLGVRFPGARVSELAGDASTRSFYRVSPKSGASIVVMDYGAAFRGETDDQRLAAIFERARLPVARILESEPGLGCLVLEDLGRRMLEQVLEPLQPQGELPEFLIRAAELAGRIASDGTRALAASDRAAGPALDADRFCFEMDFFLENFVEKHRGITGARGRIRAGLHALARRAAETPHPVLCHRDYHSRNVMVTPEGELALIDIQDARWGPDTYDIVSLVFDAYLDRPDRWIEPLIVRYLEAAGINDDALVRQRGHRVAAQRMIKALGTFGYQIEIGGNRRYEAAIPRTLGRLDRWLPLNDETSEIHDGFASLGLFDESP